MNMNYFEEINPDNMEQIDNKRIEYIKKSVSEKINCDDEREDKIMLSTNKKLKFKPLIMIAAIIATSAVSIVSVNAATDGSIGEKLKVFINNEEKSYTVVDNGEKDENGNPYIRLELDDSQEGFEIRKKKNSLEVSQENEPDDENTDDEYVFEIIEDKENSSIVNKSDDQYVYEDNSDDIEKSSLKEEEIK